MTYELAEVRRIVDEIIAERHSETVKQPAVDMLGLLLAARDAENASDRLSESEVANQVLLFPLAGRETTAVRGILRIAPEPRHTTVIHAHHGEPSLRSGRF